MVVAILPYGSVGYNFSSTGRAEARRWLRTLDFAATTKQRMADDPKLARRAILDAVENQLRENSPPEAKATLERLTAAGYSKADAKRLIGCALVIEIFDIMKTEKPYNEARYLANLAKLPELPE